MKHEKANQKQNEDDEIGEETTLVVTTLLGVGPGKFEPHGPLRDGVPRSIFEVAAQANPMKQRQSETDDGQDHRRYE